MFSFEWPWLALLAFVPLLVWLLPETEQARPALRLPTFKLMSGEQQTQYRRSFPWLWFIVWLALVGAAMRPQWLGEPITVPQEGREIMIAVDLSASMDETDMRLNGLPVNRLTMLKYVLQDFIDRRVGDRLGLILFADTAFVQTPLTFDRETVKQMLDEAVLGLVGDKTAIGDALGLAAKRFKDKDDSNRILILLTDGQNTAGNITPREALEVAKQTGIKVYTIGIGADEMEVRSFFGTRRVNPSADLDERLLTAIATETGGQYFRAKDTQQLTNIYKILDQMEPVEDDPVQLRPQQALFYWPLAFALGLSILISGLPMLTQVVGGFKRAQ
ncbi:VWA domain-containing protein [Psychrosphaera ytuae]|uniref:VWA domain-containing protein n=1 Tax=Psychrosphaera ytuae TaxID=2820710 RepID=A0A975DBA6_9GAMM|nr:VWA domain-containing protein [Psychrosphaera ytuae]QTH63698.1 VWA domain-containing protein [Psychrosphaera ytuae]